MPTINGTPGNDFLFGTQEPDIINALGGDDQVFVGSADGTGGPDIVDGGTGFDRLSLDHSAGAAATYVFSIADNLAGFVDLPDGTRIRGFEQLDAFYVPLGGNAIVTGGSGDDEIAGGSGDDILSGLGGNDRLYGGGGQDQLFGGEGDDYVSTAPRNFDDDSIAPFSTGLFDGGNGVDYLDFNHRAAQAATYEFSVAGNLAGVVTLADGTQITGFERISFAVPTGGRGLITGGAFDDQLFGGSGDDVLYGLGGNDFFEGNGGTDQIYGGDGDDQAQANGVGGVFDGGSGSNILFLTRTSNIDFVFNFADLAAGPVTMTDGTVISNFTLTGLTTGSGDDQLLGDSADQFIDSGTGNDFVNALGGNDTVGTSGSGGSFHGGFGIDTILISRIDPAGVTIGLDANGNPTFSDGTIVAEFERVQLTTGAGNDVILASNTYSSIESGAGNDFVRVIGIGLSVTNVAMGDGDDLLLNDDFGAVFASGGNGTDTISFQNSTRAVRIDFSVDQAGSIPTGGSFTFMFGFERGIGSGFDDTLIGTWNTQGLSGLGGNDTVTHRGYRADLDGGTGSDFLTITRNYGVATDFSVAENNVAAMMQADGSSFAGFERITFTGGTSTFASNDRVIGGDLVDVIDGGSGIDMLGGGLGDDLITQSGSGGSLDGGAGSDLLTIRRVGPSGSIFSIASNLAGTVTLADGTQIANFERITFTSGIGTDASNDILTGGALVDRLNGGEGLDELRGEGGNDTIDYRGVGGYLDGGSGSDFLNIGGPHAGGIVFSVADNLAGVVMLADGTRITGFETVRFNQFVSSGATNDLITGGANGDIINGHGGTDTLRGEGGNDQIQSSGTGGTFDGGIGNDLLTLVRSGFAVNFSLLDNLAAPIILADGTSFANFEALIYFSGTGANSTDDVIIGGQSSNQLNGGGGTDRLIGGNGIDIISTSGSGGEFRGGGQPFGLADTLVIDRSTITAPIVIDGAAVLPFNDIILPDGTLISGFEALQIFSGQGDDVITGGDFNDLISGGDGNDILDGRGGNNILDYSRASYGIIADMELSGTVTGGGFVDTVSGFSQINGTAFDDVIIGASIVNAGAGSDTVITNGFELVVLDGGEGDDTLSFALAIDEGVTFSLALQGLPQEYGTMRGFENVTGSALDDVLTGDGGANLIFGDAGNDRLDGGDGIDAVFGQDGDDSVSGGGGQDKVDGGAGNDIVNGGAEGDSLRGGDGDDVLDGGAGSDAMNGGTGIDIFTGGEGRDKFRFGDGDTGNSIATADRITDLDQAQGERISLTAIDAIVGGADDAFTFIGTAAFGTIAGQLRYELIGGNTYVMGDTNGDGASDFMIRVDGALVLTGADFSL